MTACIAPHEIFPGDLAAYLAGTATPAVRDHLTRCVHCATEAQALARLEDAARLARYRASCPSAETLLLYQTGKLRARDKRFVAQHIKQCAACAQDLRQFTALDAPQQSVWDEIDHALRMVVEALRLTPRVPALQTVRGGSSGSALYQADDFHIVLGAEPPDLANDAWRLRGRITRVGQADPDLRDQAVRLVAKGAVSATALIDELGYFVLEPIAPGRYDVWLEHAARDFVVRAVQVGP